MLEIIRNYVVAATGYGPGSWLDILADIATIGGIAIAVLGGYVAIRTHRSMARQAMEAHTHGLFRDYLRMRIDADLREAEDSPVSAAGPGTKDAAILEARLAGIKLYALEQMYAWVQLQQRDIHWWNRRAVKRRRRDLAGAWEATLISYILQYKEHVIEGILDYTACYSVDFLDFAQQYLKSAEVSKMARKARVALDKDRGTRYLGREERRERS